MIIRGENKYKVGSVSFTDASKLIKLIDSVDLSSMDMIDLYTIIQQGKLPKEFGSIIFTEPGSEKRIKKIEEVKSKILSDSIEKETEEKINFNKHCETDAIEKDFAESDDASDEDGEEKEKKEELYKLSKLKELSVIDSPMFSMLDNEAIGVLIENKLKKLWNNILSGSLTVDDIKKHEGGKFYNKIVECFLNEYNEVVRYVPSDGYSLPFQPNLMQKLCVYRLMRNKCYGNWSGMGSGKTLSFILSSVEINSRVTVCIVLNSAMLQVKEDILNAYPDSIVYLGWNEKIKIDYNKRNYIIINFEKFQQSYSEKYFQDMSSFLKIDFIVIDEIHSAKQRTEKQISERRGTLVRFVERCRLKNENLHILAMSGTPVVNNLYEAKSLIQILTGKEYKDIDTRRNISNAIKIYQQLLLNGLRYVPKYDIVVNEITGASSDRMEFDLSDKINDIEYYSSKGDYISIEKLMVNGKIETIKPFLSKNSIIYTYYVDEGNILKNISDKVKELGFSTAIYSSNPDRDAVLKKFKNGEIDILIGSSPIGTSINGLQKICNKMFIITLPWTNAEYSQLVGRIYRQGQVKDNVSVFIPQGVIKLKDGEWSYDKQRFDVIKHKKTLSDCAVDGIIPSKNIPSPSTLLKKASECLKLWVNRVDNKGANCEERESISIELMPEIIDKKRERSHCINDEVHQKANTSSSHHMHNYFLANPDKWREYHAAREQRKKKWLEDPIYSVAKMLGNNPGVVADLGCGTNQLKGLVNGYSKWFSFDHVAIDSSVIEADVADLSKYLENNSVDKAVFCLSLWGVNYIDYIKEAYRYLRPQGNIYVVEPDEKVKQDVLIVNALKIGFNIVGIDRSNGFTFITFEKR